MDQQQERRHYKVRRFASSAHSASSSAASGGPADSQVAPDIAGSQRQAHRRKIAALVADPYSLLYKISADPEKRYEDDVEEDEEFEELANHARRCNRVGLTELEMLQALPFVYRPSCVPDPDEVDPQETLEAAVERRLAHKREIAVLTADPYSLVLRIWADPDKHYKDDVEDDERFGELAKHARLCAKAGMTKIELLKALPKALRSSWLPDPDEAEPEVLALMTHGY